MQTVASLAERLDMTAEEAVEKLRYMLFDVDGVESYITDEQCDLLIDVDDDDRVAERFRKKRLTELEKQKKRAERLRQNAKKAAAKRKTPAKTKTKSRAKKKTTDADGSGTPEEAEEPTGAEERAAHEEAIAEILPPEAEPVAVQEPEPAAEIITEPSHADAPSTGDAVADTPVSEGPTAPEQASQEEQPPASVSDEEEQSEVSPLEGVVIEEPRVEVAPEPAPAPAPQAVVEKIEPVAQPEPTEAVEAVQEVAKTPQPEAPEAEPAQAGEAAAVEAPKASDKPEAPAEETKDEPETTPLRPVTSIEPPEVSAEIIRKQEQDERRRAREVANLPPPKPDPAVVAEVKRRAAERLQEMRAGRVKGRVPGRSTGAPAGAAGTRTPSAGRGRPAPGGDRSPAPGGGPGAPLPPAPGKTQRKRSKKAERGRAEEDKRRDAAAAVREFESIAFGGRRKKRRRSRDAEDAAPAETVANTPQVIEMEETITVEDLAAKLDVPTNDLILGLMDLDILATKNQPLDIDTARRIAEQFGAEVQSAIPELEELLEEEPDDPAKLVPRAPVITVMGHVDHGKTSLLDWIRKANVAEGEAGGITQHIAAYEAQVGDGRVVFLDTPGHEAFTDMRARGAKVTDVVVLVVAADDGVMPQTEEAINHARAADVPIVVAINKIDKPEAQPDRIRQELTRFELVPEEWGGDTIMVDISAKMGTNVDRLMELLLLQAELLELKANPDKPARGTVIESEISRGQGAVAWVLVGSGTLRLGDAYVAGSTHGRVRTMINARGEQVEEARPSTPVVVTGFSEPPNAGDPFVVVPDERTARLVAEKRKDFDRSKEQVRRHVTLETFRDFTGEGKRVLHIIIKADVQGSADVMTSSLARLGNEEVSVNVVHAGVGGINESDVALAAASEAVIIGFNVTANPRAQKNAEQEGVDVRSYQIIYEAVNEVRQALEGLLAPETREVVSGHAEIRQVFRSSALGNIAGCYVTDGEIQRGTLMRLIRDGKVVHKGRLASLKRERDDARTVASGFECGIKIDNYEDVKVGDVIEAYRLEEFAKTLE